MSRPKFTLVEVIVVCAIIGILASLGVAGYSYAQYQIKESRTKALIAKISTAIKACKEKHGFYPQSTVGYILKDLGYSEADDTSLKKMFFDDYAKIVEYENLNSNVKKFDDKELIIDGFGYPLYYRSPGLINPHSFDLYSVGNDGKIGDTDTKLWGTYEPFTSASSAPTAATADTDAFDIKNTDDIGLE